MHRLGRTIAAAGILFALLSCSASGATYVGKTEQDRRAVVRMTSSGQLIWVRIGWRARCRDADFTAVTKFIQPFDAQTPTAFSDRGPPYWLRTRGGYRSRVFVILNGRVSRRSITGTIRVAVRVTKRGRQVDRCRTPSVSFRIRR